MIGSHKPKILKEIFDKTATFLSFSIFPDFSILIKFWA